MIPIDLMLFDFDGTLVTSGEDIVLSIDYTLDRLNLPGRSKLEILTFIGDGIDFLIERSIGESHISRFAEAKEIFSDYYARHMLDHARLYPGVLDTLAHFQNKRKLIVTNKRYSFTLAMAERLGIDRFFIDVLSPDNSPFRKPDRRLADWILGKYEGDRERTVIVGDGVNDVLLAKEANLLSCVHLNGLGRRSELMGLNPDFTYQNMPELKELFF